MTNFSLVKQGIFSCSTLFLFIYFFFLAVIKFKKQASIFGQLDHVWNVIQQTMNLLPGIQS